MRLHINRGDDLDARDSSGMTPLMLAASRNKAAICDLLLSAGADPTLMGPTGQNALAMAVEAGAADAIFVFERHFPGSGGKQLLTTDAAPDSSVEANSAIPGTPTEGPYDVVVPGFDEGGNDFNLSGWEAEEDGPPPVDNTAVAESARAVHAVISSHAPIDLAEDWGDLDAFLPERVDPLPSSYDEDGRRGVLRAIRRALREGSIPERDVVALWTEEGHATNAPGEALFRFVLGDLGAETDERIELEDLGYAWEEREDNEDVVSEALAYLEDLASGRNEPMRFYGKDMRRASLLTAEEEVSLGRDMEEGLAYAVDALASWPEGLAALLDLAERVRCGEYDAESLLKEGNLDDEHVDETVRAVPTQLDETLGEEEGEHLITKHTAREFLEKAGAVAAFAGSAGCGGVGERMLRDALAAADFSPAFLAVLVDAVGSNASEAAVHYRAGILKYAKARERMMISNLRLVFSVVRRYQGLGLPLEDLIQEGNVGLIKAVDRYDWRRGFRFSTYATWWIRQQASRALSDMGKTIRTPVHVTETLLRIARQVEELEHATGHVPTAEILAQRLSIPSGKVAALMARMVEPVPLDEPDVSGDTPLDVVIDESFSVDPFAMANRTSQIAWLERLLTKLDQKKAEVIRFRYGLDDGDQRTLEETGERFGVTRERIRQIESASLKQLAQFARSERVGIYRSGSTAAANDEEDSLDEGNDKDGKGYRDETAEMETSVRGAGGRSRAAPTPDSTEPVAHAPVPGGIDRAINMARVAEAFVEDGREHGGQVVIRLRRGGLKSRALIRTLLKFGFRQYSVGEFRK